MRAARLYCPLGLGLVRLRRWSVKLYRADADSNAGIVIIGGNGFAWSAALPIGNGDQL